MLSPKRRLLSLASLPCLLASCSSEDVQPVTQPAQAPVACPGLAATFQAGDPDGHADPLGAKAAKQARASRLKDASIVPQPAHGRQAIADGDFLLINDRAAFVIEDKGISDGYARFGGELLAVDRVGEDGKPLGQSFYIETLVGISNEMIDPTSVSVLRDGSDGGEAVVRVTGPLTPIPFLDESLGALFPSPHGLEATYDYVLEPGSGKLLIRFGVVNPTAEAVDFGVDVPGSEELFGFFHFSRSQIVTAEHGYEDPSGMVGWVGYDAGVSGFAWRRAGGDLEFGIAQSGFELFWGPGHVAAACAETIVDYAEVLPTGPGLDGILDAIRRADGEPAWRTITGTVSDAMGAPVGEAWVHVLDPDGAYMSRVQADDRGAFVVQAPEAAVKLVPQQRGYPGHDGSDVAPDEATIDLAFGPSAALDVTATDATSGVPLPVRVQVIPAAGVEQAPAAFGVHDEVDGRLHQEFAVTGSAHLVVPPGTHRVIVSRGYEWELFDQEVTAAAGETVAMPVTLERTVDTVGAMCADFHIHSFYSADSSDSVELKVKGAVADGLDLPISSEHEWVIDFQPVIESLGLEAWAFGIPSEELTTFAWGHFGVVPITPRPGTLNNGAVDWIGRSPAQVFDAVHALPEDPVLVVNHPRSPGFGGYFSSSAYDTERDTGNELWSPTFDAIEVFNDSDFESNRNDVVVDWFAMLSHGRDVWAVGSSDSHHLRTAPVGYPRTCLWFDHDDPTQLDADEVRDVLASGDSTISGGLYMKVRGPDDEHPGQTAKTTGGKASFTVTVEAPSWIGADMLETIVDGKTVSTEPLMPLGAGPGKKFVNVVDVTKGSGRRSWVVFHAKGETDLAPLHPGRKPFAVSNPVFLD